MWISLHTSARRETCTLRKRSFTRPECLSKSSEASHTPRRGSFIPSCTHSFTKHSFRSTTVYIRHRLCSTHQSVFMGPVEHSDPQSNWSSHLKYRPGNTAHQEGGIRRSASVGIVLAAVHTATQELPVGPPGDSSDNIHTGGDGIHPSLEAPWPTEAKCYIITP